MVKNLVIAGLLLILPFLGYFGMDEHERGMRGEGAAFLVVSGWFTAFFILGLMVVRWLGK